MCKFYRTLEVVVVHSGIEKGLCSHLECLSGEKTAELMRKGEGCGERWLDKCGGGGSDFRGHIDTFLVGLRTMKEEETHEDGIMWERASAYIQSAFKGRSQGRRVGDPFLVHMDISGCIVDSQ